MNKVRITAIRQTVYQDLIYQYENPIEHACDINRLYTKRDVVSEWKDTFNYVPLTGECFDSIYLGVNIDEKKREKIVNYARTKLNPKIKLFQMKVDENAFRLKAEPIN